MSSEVGFISVQIRIYVHDVLFYLEMDMVERWETKVTFGQDHV